MRKNIKFGLVVGIITFVMLKACEFSWWMIRRFIWKKK